MDIILSKAMNGLCREGQGQVLYLRSRSSAYSEGHRTYMRPEDGVITRKRQDRSKGQIKVQSEWCHNL